MYFAVAQITFEDEVTSYDYKELKSLTEKLRARFRICVRVADGSPQSAPPAIVIAALHPQQESLSRLLDQVVEFCENSGFGRIAEERTILEHLESLLDESY
jgi:uncharacterized protein YlxP (DUF503 family)